MGVMVMVVCERGRVFVVYSSCIHCGHDYPTWLLMAGVVMRRFDLVIDGGSGDGDVPC